MHRTLALIALWLALPVSTWAAGPPPASARSQIEASMLVTGDIDVTADGAVAAYRLDRPDALPPEVLSLVEETIAGWRFKPVRVDGVPASVSTRASIRVRAKKIDEHRYFMGIAGARFSGRTGSGIRPRQPLAAPHYPPHLVDLGVGGTVYVVVRIAADGSVADVLAERVDLTTLGNDIQMQRMRDGLERAALAVAKTWSFAPPTGPDNAPPWLARVPVEFIPPGRTATAYGEWHAFVPGPQHDNPWPDLIDDGDPSTLVAGNAYPLGPPGPELLTPLGASTD